MPSNSGKVGFKDKISVDELVQYVLENTDPERPANEIFAELKIVDAEGITIAKV